MAKSKKGKRRCGNCAGKLPKRAASCSRCGAVPVLKSTGGMLAFIAKNAGTAAQQAGAQCRACYRPQPPGTRHCTGCGALMPGAQRLVVKSAAGAAWSDDFRRESDPERREILWKLMHPNGGGAA